MAGQTYSRLLLIDLIQDMNISGCGTHGIKLSTYITKVHIKVSEPHGHLERCMPCLTFKT